MTNIVNSEFVEKALGHSTSAVLVPYLRQSTHEDMACGVAFQAKHKDGEKMPPTKPSIRGTEIHEVLRRYVEYLVAARINADWGFFDDLLQTVGPEAAGILTGFRERYTFDFDKVYATEMKLSSDELESEGTLDVILMESPTEARIVDYKSYFQIFDVEKEPTFQSRLYPLLLFLNNAALTSVIFELVFVRYGAIRKVTYTHEDIPKLKQLVVAARKRQVALYREDAKPEATPGPHCLGGETRFITDKGIRTLKDACGEKVVVLNRHGLWEEAQIRSFGVQKLMRVTFNDGSVIRATPGHRWWKLKKSRFTEGWIQTDERITTMDLDRVPLVRHAEMPNIDEEGIRHGFTYGDGHRRAHRPSSIAVITPPKDLHMLQYFPGAHRETDGRYRKGALPGYFKTLDEIKSPSYARGFTAGVIAADGSVVPNGAVYLYAEGRLKALAIAEIIRFGGGVVTSVLLCDGKPTSFSPKGATSREMMRISIKPRTAPIISPVQRERLKPKNQMRLMYRKVVSIEDDATEEVFCAVVPGSESFTLANGIATSNCTYCPLLRTHRCPLGTMNPFGQDPGKLLQIVMQQKKALAENSLILREMVKDLGAVETSDANAGKYRAEYTLTSQRKIPLMPFLTVMQDWMHASDEDLSAKVFIASTELRSLRGAKKRAILDQALADIEVTKEATRFQIVDGEEEAEEL